MSGCFFLICVVFYSVNKKRKKCEASLAVSAKIAMAYFLV